MTVTHFDIARDFTPHLGPRERKLGEFSGEELFDTLLPIYEAASVFVVELDGIEGPTPSCLDEAFGGLVRRFGLQDVKKKLRLKALRNSYLVPMIEGWMAEAEAKRLARLR